MGLISRIKTWLVKRYIKRRLKQMRREGKDVSKILAILAALKNPQTSEFWMTWGTVIVTTLVKFVPGAAGIVAGIAGFLGTEPAMLVAGAIAYIVGRFTNKAANA